MKPNAQSKVLAINFGGIGDEILFLPTLKSVRAAIPGCHLTLLLEPRSRSVQQVCPLIDRIVTFDIKKRPLYVSDLMELVGLIREGGYDVLISSGSSKLVSILLFLGGVEKRIGYDSGKLSHILLTNPVPLNRDQYAAMMYHDLATGLGVQPACADKSIPEITVPSANMSRMLALLAQNVTTARRSDAGGGAFKRIILHPGTSRLAVQKGIIKTWANDNWLQLIRFLSAEGNIEVLLAGGPDDEEIIADIMRAVPAEAPLINCYGKTRDLADLAALIHLSDAMVCVDSAPMHLGVALRKPLVALFGPTDEKKLVPDDPRFKTLRGGPVTACDPQQQPQLQPRSE
ncbi:MAG: glycosyltransferase family 9 protein, partial [Terriglobales bacterium]